MSDTISLTEWAASLPDTGDTTIAAKVLKGLVEERDDLREMFAEELQHSEAQAKAIERLSIERSVAMAHLEDERKLTASQAEQIARLTAELRAADYSDYVREQYPL